jgi:energy-coupling factor transporter ATP-binding protein EcfA2
MSHRKTVIEPSAGLTVLIGPNNCGKSALVAALQILCHNENSTYVKRHGQKECAVVVHTSEGNVIEWRRKTSPRYIINGVEHSRLGNAGVPAELHSLLRLPLVADEDDDSFNVHFGSQKSPIFLLNSRAGAAAKFFASSSDAIRLLEMQQRHKEKVTEARRQHQQLEAEASIVSAELETLEATVPLADRLGDLEQDFQRLGSLEAEIEALIDSEAELVNRQELVDVLTAISEALGLLKLPPELQDPGPLEIGIERLEHARRESLRLAREADCLSGLRSPPLMEVETGLDGLVVAFDDVGVRIQRLERHRESLANLPLPPVMEDSIALQALVRQFERATRDAATSDVRAQTLRTLAEPPLWSETTELEQLNERLDHQVRQVEEFSRRARIASVIKPPPTIEEDAPLALDLERLEVATGRVMDMTHALEHLHADLSDAEMRLREAASTETCPTCGQSYDAERLMDLTGSLGGHAHGAA